MNPRNQVFNVESKGLLTSVLNVSNKPSLVGGRDMRAMWIGKIILELLLTLVKGRPVPLGMVLGFGPNDLVSDGVF